MDPSSHATFSSFDPHANHIFFNQTNTSVPQAQNFTCGAYDNSPAEGNEYHGHFINIEAMDAASMCNCGENRSPMSHTSYGYSLQMPYGPYSPVTTPLPSSGEGHLYYPRYFSSACPYFQQLPSSNALYLHTTFPVSRADLPMSVERQDWLRSPEGTVSVIPFSSPAISREPVGPVGSFGRGIISSSAMVSQQQTPFYAFGSSSNSYNQGYFHDGRNQHGNDFGNSTHRIINDGCCATDQGRHRSKGNASTHSFGNHPNERNRGPRATRRKNIIEQGLPLDSKNSNTPGVYHELYNMPDFNIDYKDAKFFIIKSYNEENIHKSIKYGVWASTPNGNKKLDAAYHDAKEKGESCPVFLFFSVNESAQFCGIAEMIGCVDFDKSVDYWQQDKWSGQIPVKWHVIKDVPNSMFRHIILESNDYMPVTNSRDTQEVKLEYGLEMLGIFKNYGTNVSILDDFEFYEEKEKAMRESKSHRRRLQQLQQQEKKPQPSNSSSPISLRVVDRQQPNPAPAYNEFVGHITKNFAEAVRLGKLDKDCGSSDRSNSGARSEESRRP